MTFCVVACGSAQNAMSSAAPPSRGPRSTRASAGHTARTAETPPPSPARRGDRRSAARSRHADGAAAGAPAPTRYSRRRRARRSLLWCQPWSHEIDPSRSFGAGLPRRMSEGQRRGLRSRRHGQRSAAIAHRRRSAGTAAQAVWVPITIMRRDIATRRRTVKERQLANAGGAMSPAGAYSLGRRDGPDPGDDRVEVLDRSSSRSRSGAASAGRTACRCGRRLGQRAPELGVGPCADARGLVRGDVFRRHRSLRRLEDVAAAAVPFHVVRACRPAGANGTPCNGRWSRDRSRA